MTLNAERNLENITLEDNDQNMKQLKGIKRILYMPYAVYWKGGQVKSYQEESAEKSGLKPENLTILNAVICGFGGALLYYHLGRDSHYFFGEHFVHKIAGVLGTTTEYSLYGVSAFMAVQSALRTFYSIKKKKAVAAIGVEAFIGDALTFFYKKMRTKPQEGFEPPTPSLQNSCSNR